MLESKWYIIHSYSQFETKVAESIREQAKLKGLSELIEDIRIPTEEVLEIYRGKKRTVEKRRFPGYVLVRAKLSNPVYHLIKDTPKVSGFLGPEGGKKPSAVPMSEVDRILGTLESSRDRPRPVITFEVGEVVRVNDGAFQGFEGEVEEIDEDKGRLKVTVSIFGRATPVDLEYGQVDKS